MGKTVPRPVLSTRHTAEETVHSQAVGSGINLVFQPFPTQMSKMIAELSHALRRAFRIGN